MRHYLFRAVIGEREQAAAVGHHLLGAVGDGRERVAGDVHGHREILGRRIDIAALELLLVGEGDRMNEKIERRPDGFQLLKAGIDRALFGHVAIDQRRRVERLDEGDDALLERVSLVGEGKLGSGLVERARDTPGDGAFIGDAHDEPAFALHEVA
jgi:hypothetical protein